MKIFLWEEGWQSKKQGDVESPKEREKGYNGIFKLDKFMRRIVVFLVLGSVWAGCGNKQKGEAAKEKEQARVEAKAEVAEVKVEKVKSAPFELELVSNGKVDACRKAVLNFIVNDVIDKVYVKNGERVKAGMPILSVDVYQAQQQLEEARLAKEKMALEFRSRLMSEGINDLADTVNAELLPPARLEVIKLQSGYTSALNTYNKALYDYNNVTVYAPFSGIVADLDAREYNQSTAYKQVCTLIDDSKMEVVFNVLETEIANLSEGMEVEITPYADNTIVLKGKVTEVNPRIDENGMVRVKTVTMNPKGVLVDGMNVSILLKRKMGTQLIVPKSSVLPRQGRKVVFVHENGKALWKYVTTGPENSREVCIESGLQEGEEAIYENNLGLSHECEVKVIK